VFVYRLPEPIDSFDGLTPLAHWLAGAGPGRTSWALGAVLALADTAAGVGWRGDMRHLPLVGALPTRPQATPYLLVKQDDGGATFLVTDAAPAWVGETAACAQVAPRPIGAWEPATDDPGHLDADTPPY
jgi:hypothetical protein